MPAAFAFEPPHGWTPAEEARPTLSAGSDVTIDLWSSWRAPDGGEGRAVSACFGMDLGTWIDEATPVALERLASTASSVALRLDGASPGMRVVREERSPEATEQALALPGAKDAPVVARTVLGFASGGEPRVTGCFVLCSPTTRDCERSVETAKAEGFVPPPPASAFARSVAYGIHHPRGVAAASVALFLLAGVVAVWTRPRPRRK